MTRAMFEHLLSSAPYSLTVERFPEGYNNYFTGQYVVPEVQLAWEVVEKLMGELYEKINNLLDV